jgi:6-phosphogluconolactonase
MTPMDERENTEDPMNPDTRSTFRFAGAVVLLWGVGMAASAQPGQGTSGPKDATTLRVYVGTYTDAGSRGIYRFDLDLATGTPTAPVLAAETKSPSFVALHPNRRFLYAVGEAGGTGGTVSAFALDAGGDLKPLNTQPSGGGGPCHLIVDPAGRNVLVANYGGGSVAVLPVAQDGLLAAPSSVRQHQGSGPNARRQEKPHAHGVVLDAAARFAFVPDLGADRIFIYRYDAGRGLLEPNDPPAAALDPGAGPRHIAFHPSGRFLYSINELRSTVTAFKYDAQKGALEPVQTISALPQGFEGQSSTAEVQVSRDGRFLYGSNRGHDSLAVFAIDAATGRLTPKGHVPSGGKSPRHFAIDPTGQWILAAHQGSDNIVVFKLDAATGMPAPNGKAVTVSKPVCVEMMPLPR